jgi:hypothetical protein
VRARFGGPLPPMANTFLAGPLGVTTSQVARARGLLTDELTPADFGPPLGHFGALQPTGQAQPAELGPQMASPDGGVDVRRHERCTSGST